MESGKLQLLKCKQERRMTEQYTPDSCAIGDDTLMIDVFVLEISKKNNNNLYN